MRLDPLHRNQEAVAAPRYGLDVLRFFGGVAERLPGCLDRGVNTVLEVDDGVVGPELPLYLFAGDQFTPVLQQDGQQSKRFLWQANRLPSAEQFSGSEVELKASEADPGWQGIFHGVFPGFKESILPRFSGSNR